MQLLRMRPAFVGEDVAYVTVNRASRAEIGSARFYVVNDATRWNKWGLIKLAIRMTWIMLRERPDTVITTGAARGRVYPIADIGGNSDRLLCASPNQPASWQNQFHLGADDITPGDRYRVVGCGVDMEDVAGFSPCCPTRPGSPTQSRTTERMNCAPSATP